jgi:hypothetical protein
MIRTPASQRYNWRLIWLSLLYALFLIGAVYGFKQRLVPGSIAYLVAVLPALPVIGIFAAIGRYLVEEQDEYARMLMVRQTLWASGFALSLATVWGFLESFDLVGHVDGYWVAVAWLFGLAIGGMVNKATFGDSGSGC